MFSFNKNKTMELSKKLREREIRFGEYRGFSFKDIWKKPPKEITNYINSIRNIKLNKYNNNKNNLIKYFDSSNKTYQFEVKIYMSRVLKNPTKFQQPNGNIIKYKGEDYVPFRNGGESIILTAKTKPFESSILTTDIQKLNNFVERFSKAQGGEALKNRFDALVSVIQKFGRNVLFKISNYNRVPTKAPVINPLIEKLGRTITIQLSDKYVKYKTTIDPNYIAVHSGLKNICWFELIINRLYEVFKLNNIDLTIDHIWNICFPHSDIPSQFEPMSFLDILPFFQYYNISIYKFNREHDLRCAYVSKKGGYFNNLPRSIFVMAHNKHIYLMDNEVKSLGEKTKNKIKELSVYFEDNKGIIYSIDPLDTKKYDTVNKKPFYIPKDDVEIETMPILCSTFQDVMDIFRDFENGELTREVNKIVFNGSLYDLSYNMYKQGYDHIVYSNVDFYTKLSFEYFGIDIVGEKNQDGTSIDLENMTSDDYVLYKSKENEFMRKSLNVSYMSKYNDSSRDWLIKHKRGGVIGLINDIPKNCDDFIGLDFIKDYPSSLIQFEYLPVLRQCDFPQLYDGHNIEDYTIYLIRKTDSFGLTEYKFCFPHKTVMTVCGMILKKLPPNNYKILEFLRPSGIVKNPFRQIFEDWWKTELHSNKEIDKTLHKWSPNKLIGIFGKTKNVRGKGHLYLDEAEAFDMKRHRGGGVLIVNNEETNDKHFLHYTKSESELISGFLPIHMMIIDHTNYKLFKLIEDLQSVNITPLWCHTDCVNIKKSDEDKLALLDQDYFKVDDGILGSFGKLKIDHKVKKCIYSSKINVREIEYEPIQEPKINEYILKNEKYWQLNEKKYWQEIDQLFSKSKRWLILGKMGGVGKSFLSLKYLTDRLKIPKEKILIICPYNKQRLKMKKQGYNAFTTCNFLHTNIADPERKIKFINYNDLNEKYEAVIFDEIFLNNVSQQHEINLFMDNFNGYIMGNGDVRQLPSIGIEKLLNNIDNIPIHLNLYVKRIFGNVLTLNINKRNTDPKIQQLYIKLFNLLVKSDKQGMIKLLLENCHTIKNLNDISTEINIAHDRQTCKDISNMILRKKYKGILKNRHLVCVNTRTLECEKKVYTMVEYPIVKSYKNIYTLHDEDEDENFEITQDEFDKYFMLNFCRTGHSYQGDTIAERYTIDLNDYMISCEWIWVAVGRADNWENIYIYYNEEEAESRRLDLNRIIKNKIKGYKEQDKNKGRTWGKNDYIAENWILEKIQGCCPCCSCELQTDGVYQFVVDRLNNDLPHTKDNCHITCYTCNRIDFGKYNKLTLN
jgi:hypothetical protein